MAKIGMIAGRQPCRNHHDEDDQCDRLEHRLDQLIDGLGDELGRVVADVVVDALGEVGLEAAHHVLNALRGRQRVGAGALRHGQRHRGFAEQVGVGGVAQRAQLDPAHVAQLD